MKCFSLFSGIGGFDLALQRQGHEIVGACEIDKYARSVYRKHFPNVPVWEDATKIRPEELPDFEMLCAGFPCQPFSLAGKRLGFEDTRGQLFHEIARIAKEKRPRYLFLENVKGLLYDDNHRTITIILNTFYELGYDVEWKGINGKYFLPQNRDRIFIIGHLRGESRPKIFPFTESSRQDDRMAREKPEERKQFQNRYCGTITSSYYKGWGGARPMIAEPMIKRLEGKPNVYNTDAQAGKVYDIDGISPTVSGQRINSQGFIAVPVLTPNRPKKRQNGRRFKTDGEPSFTITTQDRHGIYDGKHIRMLTPLECERLQGFPDGWTEGLSDTRRYICLGNAVMVPVIERILEEITH